MSQVKQTKKSLYLFAIFLVLYEFTTYSTNDMIMPGMLQVVREYSAPLSYVGLSLSIYILGGTLLQLFLGPMAERYGKRRLILIGSTFFVIITAALIFSFSINEFLFLRLLQGMGLAFIAIGYLVIHENFSDTDALKIITLMANVSILAPLLGPMVGSLIVSYLNWRFVYIIAAALGIISVAGLYRFTPVKEANAKSINLKQIITGYLKVVKNPNFKIAASAIGLVLLPNIAWIGLAPTMLINKLKLSYLDYSLYQMLAIGGFSLCGIIMQFISGKVRLALLIKGGYSLCLIGTGVFFASLFVHNPREQLLVLSMGFFIYGFGCGFCNGTIMRLIVTEKSYSQNFAMSLLIFTMTLSMVIGLDVFNRISSYFNFSLSSFALESIVTALAAIFLLTKLGKVYNDRGWQ